MGADVDTFFKSPLREALPQSHPRTWSWEKKAEVLGRQAYANPDAGLAEFIADLRNPDVEINAFQIECVTLYKNMAESKVLKCKLTYEPNGVRKEVIAGTGYDEIFEVVQQCAYDLEPQQYARVFVAYGSWDPTATPGYYKLHRRPDYLKIMQDPDKAYKDWIKDQNKARREMEARGAW